MTNIKYNIFLPDDIISLIICFIPRNKTAEIIHKYSFNLKLRYVRKFAFYKSACKYNVWNDLKPSNLLSIFYGDKKHIIRSNISKGQFVKLKIN